jgi:hypothetical protein
MEIEGRCSGKEKVLQHSMIRNVVDRKDMTPQHLHSSKVEDHSAHQKMSKNAKGSSSWE